MDISSETRERILLEQIEHDPDVTQASLATQLGVAVGTVNWHVKRLIKKGYIKATRAQRKKLRYVITPEGLAFRALLTVDYIENSLMLYRRTRRRVRELLSETRQAGFDSVRIAGDGDLADIIRLTCLEEGVKIDTFPGLPALEVRGWKVYLNLDDLTQFTD
ncbi:MAG: winged helix-turn-helix transcriptional regulator [Chloroflexi bacterium]|nr:winged helix-turn-helix transcriptional regulator [Chloroflexota bacterium]